MAAGADDDQIGAGLLGDVGQRARGAAEDDRLGADVGVDPLIAKVGRLLLDRCFDLGLVGVKGRHVALCGDPLDDVTENH